MFGEVSCISCGKDGVDSIHHDHFHLRHLQLHLVHLHPVPQLPVLQSGTLHITVHSTVQFSVTTQDCTTPSQDSCYLQFLPTGNLEHLLHTSTHITKLALPRSHIKSRISTTCAQDVPETPQVTANIILNYSYIQDSLLNTNHSWPQNSSPAYSSTFLQTIRLSAPSGSDIVR